MRFIFLILLAAFSASAQALEQSDQSDLLLARMDEAERDYYDKLFDYVMDNRADGQTYDWKSYRAYGRLTPASKETHENTVCRPFHEIIGLKDESEAAFNGIACKRVGSDGWCRLPKGELRSCALEKPRSFLGRLEHEKQGLVFKGSEALRQTKENWGSWWPF